MEICYEVSLVAHQLIVNHWDGFKPHDPMNLTPQEASHEQLNATALHMLGKGNEG
jgi:hypothetical protein